MFPSLYAVLDATLAGEQTVPIARALAASSVGIIQYRNKNGSARVVFEACTELAGILRGRSRFIVNDRADVAMLCGADGVHVGQEDIDVEDARGVCGSERWVGVSTHNIAQLRSAIETSSDYIAVGPIFPTPSKENPDPVVGVDFICQARRMTSKPLVAIGGITLENAAEVYRAGADSIAVIRDLIASPDPGARAAQYQIVADEFRSQGRS
jgi:thiamine-phosphate pyrophosphorylase